MRKAQAINSYYGVSISGTWIDRRVIGGIGEREIDRERESERMRKEEKIEKRE